MEQGGSSLDLDRSKTALVVIDLQKGIAGRQTAPHDCATVVANAARLADAFRASKMPVFLVRFVASDADRLRPIADEQPWRAGGAPPEDFAEFVPELEPREGDIVIGKKQWGAFYGTELDLQLRRRRIETIVLCGIATNYGVESTARFAYEYGYQQVFVSDAMAAMSAEAHDGALRYTFARIGRVRTTAQVLDGLR